MPATFVPSARALWAGGVYNLRRMTAVRLENIRKTFGATVALDAINLQINAGELFFLLGPSGCGKSTLLRLVAGLHEPTSGRILFNDRDVTALGTEHRNAVMCFQSYALWPHMTVRDNVRFGLKVRHAAKSEQDARVAEVLRLVRMADLAHRKPNELSGGQQQRVALARALAVKPDCLLLDEPLSNLDAKLRQEMRSEIRRICKESGFTTIYVTHDQKEALSVADRIAVMKDGGVAQVGTPGELYRRPRTSFVADFIGQTNLIPGTVVARNGSTVEVKTAAGTIRAAGFDPGQAPSREDVVLSIRPEEIRPARSGAAASDGRNQLSGDVVETTFFGETSEHVMVVGGQRLRLVRTPPMFDASGTMTVEFDAEDVVVLPE
jgi:iron(III) transport system ATP-binding protein